MRLEVAKKIAEEMTSINFRLIEPVLGGGNSRIFRLDHGTGSCALKFFRTDVNNARDRFDAETSALNIFAENGMKCVPKLVAQDKENNCTLMEWINGETVTDFSLKDIDALSDFVKTVHNIFKQNNSNHIRFATDACLNGNEIVAQINQRLEYLKPACDINPELQEFLNEDFIPTFKKITAWSKEEYLINGMVFDQDISQEQLTLSLVDIGFHNCLRTEDQLYFLDFEFFGRDDPVKLIADTLQHPASKLGKKQNDYLENKLQKIFNADYQFKDRLKCLFFLFGLKWCMIMLNPFLPDYKLINIKDKNIKISRFKEVKQKLDQIKSTKKVNYRI